MRSNLTIGRSLSRAAVFAASILLFVGLAHAIPPNIIYVMTDDQGYGDLAMHGNPHIRTPNLDRFGGDGVELTRFYANPVCSPTRAALMTGRYFYRTGIIHTSRGAAKMHGDEVTLAEYLTRAGYRTGIFGKWHLGDNYPMRPEDQGFDESLVHRSGGITQTPDADGHYFDPPLYKNGRPVTGKGYCTDIFFDAAIEFVAANHDRPFFVYLPTNAPHTPLEVAENYSQPYEKLGLDQTTAKVYGMVQNIDENFGRLLAKLDDLNLRRNTLVVFTTDNGHQQDRFSAGLRGKKTQVYEGGVRVPWLAQWPARWEGNRKIDTIAAPIDMLPTLLEAAGLPVSFDAPIDGRSLLPILDGKAGEWRDRTLFVQVHRGMTPHLFQNAAAITQKYKLVAYADRFNLEKFDIPAEPVLELYDILADPAETTDLAAKLPDEVARLRQAYEDWFHSIESTRSFEPGIIHLGSDRENPTLLCRYQDGDFAANRALGWRVAIEREGRYRISIRPEQVPAGGGKLEVTWNSQPVALEPDEGGTSATAVLSSGKGLLDVAMVANDGDAKRDTTIDCIVELLKP